MADNVVESVDVVTRADRGLEWLDRCYDSLRPLRVNWTWHIMVRPQFIQEATLRRYERTVIHQAPNHASVHDALSGINQYLDEVPDRGQWFFCLDDDNLMHPNFDKLANLMRDSDIVFFSQQLGPSHARVIVPERFWPGFIDMAQFVSRRSAMGELRFWEIYRGDSYYIQEMVFRAKGGMGFLPRKITYFYDVASYYNAQRRPFTSRP